MRDGGFLDLDRLEAALQRGILLDVLAVLVQRGGTDGLELAAGQHGLQDRGRIDGAFGGTGTHQGVDLIDEQDDVAAGADLLEDLLQALFEVTAVAGAGHEGPEVQGVQLLVLDGLRDVAADDRLGQALDDGGLADAGLADQHRVVLGAAGKDLHDAFHFLLAADHGVQLVLARRLGQVAAELVQDNGTGGGALGLAGADAGAGGFLALVAGEQLDDLLADPVQVGAELDEHLGGNAFTLPDKAEQDVLGTNVVMAQLQRLAQRELQDLLGAGGEGDVAGGGLLALADDLLDLLADAVERNAQGFKGFGGNTFTLMDQTQEDVFGTNVIVVQHACLFLGKHNYATGTVRKSLKHFATLLATTYFDATWPGSRFGACSPQGKPEGCATAPAGSGPVSPARRRRNRHRGEPALPDGRTPAPSDRVAALLPEGAAAQGPMTKYRVPRGIVGPLFRRRPGRNMGGGACSSPDGRADLPDGRTAAGMAMPPSDNGGIGI